MHEETQVEALSISHPFTLLSVYTLYPKAAIHQQPFKSKAETRQDGQYSMYYAEEQRVYTSEQ